MKKSKATEIICISDKRCYREDCRYQHSNSKCEHFEKCFDFYCTARHDRSRTRPCRNGSKCTSKKNCKFLHPRLPPTCSSGPECKDVYCLNFHLTDVQKLLTAEQRLQKFRSHLIKAIRQHEIKIRKARKQLLNHQETLELVGDNNGSRESITALKTEVEELLQQRQAFSVTTERALCLFLEGKLTSQQCCFLLNREMYRLEAHLPALAKRIEIENYLVEGKSRFIVIKGHTGSGKSTQIPQYVADLPEFYTKRVICTQPRKIAAVSLAKRVAVEYAGGKEHRKDAQIGSKVGYRVGGEKQVRRGCRIEFDTEGVLLDAIVNGPSNFFEDVCCIILDETHERSINCDILMGFLKQNDPRWNHIKVLITSATIDTTVFSDFFNNAPIVEIQGKLFPVEVFYEPTVNALMKPRDMQIAVVATALKIHEKAQQNIGDILCFLPGQEDVQVAKNVFENEIRTRQFKNQNPSALHCQVFSLFGKQDPDDQREVFKKLPADMRKIIFSTDVAETSITIDGVQYVIDSGVRKGIVFDSKRNISALKLQTISKSSAIQRRGRAGRTAPGKCYCLYSEEEFQLMDDNTTPEIFRQPLSLAILTLRSMRISPLDFDWITAPASAAIETAEKELLLLGALDDSMSLTELGKLITNVQQDPRLVRMVFRGCKDGMGEASITVAALMSVASMIFWRGKDNDAKMEAISKNSKFLVEHGDIVSMYHIFKQWKMIRAGLTKTANNGVLNIKEDFEEETNDSVRNMLDGEQLNFNFQIAPVPLLIQNSEYLSDGTVSDSEESVASTCADTDDAKSDSMSVAGEDETPIDDEEEDNNDTTESVEDKQNDINNAEGSKSAGVWCRENALNNKALNIALKLTKELRQAFKSTGYWKERQDKEPDDYELKRLIVSGLFLNVALQIGPTQYYALLADVVGYEHNASALMRCNVRPKWLVFDKILRISSTLLVSTTPINEEWIKEESPNFYKFITEKSETLPSKEVQFTNLSFGVLRMLLGKNFAHLEDLELSLSCSIHVDVQKGLLAARCTPAYENSVKSTLDSKIKAVKQEMNAYAAEETWLGGTRVVIGAGAEVLAMLFNDEFVTVYLRDLPKDESKETLKTRLGKYGTIRACETSKSKDGTVTATVSFCRKLDAEKALRDLKGEIWNGQQIIISRGGIQNPGITKEIVGILKISWASAPSCGKAKICFSSAETANTVLEQSKQLFPSGVVVYASGDKNSGFNRSVGQRTVRGNFCQQTRPPLTADGKFDIARIRQLGKRENESPVYCLHVHNLALDVDELSIINILKGFPIRKVVVERQSGATENPSEDPMSVQVERILSPLLIYQDSITSRTEYSDGRGHRAGFKIYFNDITSIETVSKDTHSSKVWKEMTFFGQPIRVESEYCLNATVHQALSSFLKGALDEVKSRAERKGIHAFSAPSVSSARITMRFTAPSLHLLGPIQESLESITACSVFHHEKKDVLFTRIGRIRLNELSNLQLTYLHWDNKTRQIWIYAQNCDAKLREQAQQQLSNLVEELSSMELEEETLVLNKKYLGTVETELPMLKNKTGVLDLTLNGCRLFVSGSKTSVSQVHQFMKAKLFRPKGRSELIGAEKSCGVCGCDVVDLSLQACHHTFHKDCMQPMFTSVQIPVQCPGDVNTAEQCQQSLIWTDIAMLCTPESDAGAYLRNVAVKDYELKHQHEIIRCPQPGCSQLLPRYLMPKVSDSSGGQCLFCDQCIKSYCIACSEKMNKPVKMHKDLSCDDVCNGLSAEAHIGINHIREKILNLQCPRCKNAFLDYAGCAALTCGNQSCHCAFCACCLKDCGSDAHQHVLSCPMNPAKGGYYITCEQFQEMHRQRREKEVKEYVSGIRVEKVRQQVLKAVQRDLQDLRIPVPS